MVAGPPNAAATLKLIEQLMPKEFAEISELMGQINKLENVAAAKNNFIEFAKAMWPGILIGRHHYEMAKVIEGVVLGDKKRSITNMAPRMTKSEFFSYLMPAWYIGHNPSHKIVQICGTADLAIGWSRKVRNLVATEEYQAIFPGVGLRADSKAAGRWHTSHGGEYFAVGAEGNVTGKGGDVVIIDDPTGEQQAVAALTDPTVYRKVYDWYVAGPRQRLQPKGRICVVQSRWAKNDFTGQLLDAEKKAEGLNVDHWEVIELPAVLPSGNSIWPEFWSAAELERTRLSLPAERWESQYLQKPSGNLSAIIKRDWWKIWQYKEPPECHFKLTVMDTAYSDKETADYTAVLTFGIFKHGDGGVTPDRDKLILLDAWKERITFPDLKAKARKYYMIWKPDAFLIEAKAAGAPLIYELRAGNIPVTEWQVTRGTSRIKNNKVMRVNSITDILASGMVWAPDTKWAEEVIEECAAFPKDEHDDYVDCLTMALARFRQGGLISLPTDDWDNEPLMRRPSQPYY
jgi:predicted phage terminase large subunit-like protein